MLALLAVVVASANLPGSPAREPLSFLETMAFVPDDSLLARRLDARTTEFQGRAGIVVLDPRRGKVLYEHDADAVAPAASLYKLAVLVEAQRRIEARLLGPGDAVELANEDFAEGELFSLPEEVTVETAVEAMISRSSNATASALLRAFGRDAVVATARRYGVQPLEFRPEGSFTSPRAMATLFSALAKGELVSPAASERMIALLEHQAIADRIRAALPPGARVANKTGNLDLVTHDAGIIYGSGGAPLVLVAMTWEGDEASAIALIRQLAAFTYEHASRLPR